MNREEFAKKVTITFIMDTDGNASEMLSSEQVEIYEDVFFNLIGFYLKDTEGYDLVSLMNQLSNENLNEIAYRQYEIIQNLINGSN